MALLLMAESPIEECFLLLDTPVKSQMETTEKVMETLDYAGALQLFFLDCISPLHGGHN